MDVGVKKPASFPDFSKSGKRAAEWKKQGNSHFRRRELSEALQCYAEVENIGSELVHLLIRSLQAAFASPWPGGQRQRILSHLLSCVEPQKRHFATSLYSTEQNTDESQSSLLAMCIGNRSAVLYEMNKPKVCTMDFYFYTSSKHTHPLAIYGRHVLHILLCRYSFFLLFNPKLKQHLLLHAGMFGRH